MAVISPAAVMACPGASAMAAVGAGCPVPASAVPAQDRPCIANTAPSSSSPVSSLSRVAGGGGVAMLLSSIASEARRAARPVAGQPAAAVLTPG
jgi:hypothetical protein